MIFCAWLQRRRHGNLMKHLNQSMFRNFEEKFDTDKNNQSKIYFV